MKFSESSSWLNALRHRLQAFNRERLNRRRERRHVAASHALFGRQAALAVTLRPEMLARAHSVSGSVLLSLLWLPDVEGQAVAPWSELGLTGQYFEGWELLTDRPLAAGALADPRVRVIPTRSGLGLTDRSHALLAQARGDYVLLLKGRDRLFGPHALLYFAEAAVAFDRPPILYADEVCQNAEGLLHAPMFKCDWNQELQRSAHALGRAYMLRTDALRDVGGWPDLPDDAADQVAVLQASEQRPDRPAVHLPHLLYVRECELGRVPLMPSRATDAQAVAVRDHLDRRGQPAQVSPAEQGGLHIRYPIAEPAPLVSLIVPTRNGLSLLKQCVDSLLAKTRYPNFEVLIVDNGSDDPETLAWMRAITADARVRVRRDERPFNFSALNNHALPDCRGSIIGMLNNDTEVIAPDWLDDMVGLVLRPDVGAVGSRLWYSHRALQHAGVLLGIGGAAGHAHAKLAEGDPGYLGRAVLTQEFSAVTAACLLVRREVFEQVEGLDEQNLAIDLNDIDFCLRLRSAGYRVIWSAQAELFHHESATRGHPTRPDQMARYTAERRYFCDRWKDWLGADPAYNPNLTLDDASWAVAASPRIAPDRPFMAAPADCS